MGMEEAVRSVLNNYANFNGRARRSEYWYFTLFIFLVSLALSVAGFILRIPRVASLLDGLLSLAILVPSLSVTWRRLHDSGKPGWFFLVSFVPVIGWIAMIILLCLDSEPGDNLYGPNPKDINDTFYS